MCFLDFYGFGELYEEWYVNQYLERDFIKVSKDGIEFVSVIEKFMDCWIVGFNFFWMLCLFLRSKYFLFEIN